MLDRVNSARRRKVKALFDRAGTEGEARAAEAALMRIAKSDERSAFTDKIVSSLPVPKSGYRVFYDVPDQNKKKAQVVSGFGVRVTSSGFRSFVLNYRNVDGRERRYTIGSPPVWNVTAAREEAKTLRYRIDQGEDPVAEKKAARGADSMSDLCAKFEADYLPMKRPSTQAEYKAMIQNDIKPEFGNQKVKNVTYDDIQKLHRKVTARGTPYRANRLVALLSKMFTLAIKWNMRTDNPAKGIERNIEEPRKRYLNAAERKRLFAALDDFEDKQTADIIRLLLLTGARSGEVCSARWNQFDLEDGTWTKPGATTKQKTDHRVPLSRQALDLLKQLRKMAPKNADFVFPGRSGGHRTYLAHAWRRLCKTAKIENARIHDLRHTYASVLASDGQSLPVIGALLGHTQAQTTHRYVHLFDNPLRAATNQAGSSMGMRGGRRKRAS